MIHSASITAPALVVTAPLGDITLCVVGQHFTWLKHVRIFRRRQIVPAASVRWWWRWLVSTPRFSSLASTSSPIRIIAPVIAFRVTSPTILFRTPVTVAVFLSRIS